MKQFFKYVFATVTGIIIFHLIVLLIFVISIMSMGSKGAVKVQDNSVLEINLTGNISERTEENPLASFIGNPNAGNISLENVLKAIKRAKEEDFDPEELDDITNGTENTDMGKYFARKAEIQEKMDYYNGLNARLAGNVAADRLLQGIA